MLFSKKVDSLIGNAYAYSSRIRGCLLLGPIAVDVIGLYTKSG